MSRTKQNFNLSERIWEQILLSNHTLNYIWASLVQKNNDIKNLYFNVRAHLLFTSKIIVQESKDVSCILSSSWHLILWNWLSSLGIYALWQHRFFHRKIQPWIFLYMITGEGCSFVGVSSPCHWFVFGFFNEMSIFQTDFKNFICYNENFCWSTSSIRFTLVKLLHGNGIQIRQMHVIKYHYQLWLANHDHGQNRWLDSSLGKTEVRKQDVLIAKMSDVLDN